MSPDELKHSREGRKLQTNKRTKCTQSDMSLHIISILCLKISNMLLTFTASYKINGHSIILFLEQIHVYQF